MSSSYIEGKLRVKLGENFFKTYYTDSKYQNINSIIEWAKILIDEMPSTYKKFGKITLKVRRVYPDIPEEIYKSDWHKIKNKELK